jgi:hypothetical protein
MSIASGDETTGNSRVDGKAAARGERRPLPNGRLHARPELALDPATRLEVFVISVERN